MIAKSHQVRVGEQSFNVFPSQPETVQALWSALPPDLRLALAKTAPRMAGKWVEKYAHCFLRLSQSDPSTLAAVELTGGDRWRVAVVGLPIEHMDTLAEAQAACDAALIAQGYVLDGPEAP